MASFRMEPIIHGTNGRRCKSRWWLKWWCMRYGRKTRTEIQEIRRELLWRMRTGRVVFARLPKEMR